MINTEETGWRLFNEKTLLIGTAILGAGGLLAWMFKSPSKPAGGIQTDGSKSPAMATQSPYSPPLPVPPAAPATTPPADTIPGEPATDQVRDGLTAEPKPTASASSSENLLKLFKIPYQFNIYEANQQPLENIAPIQAAEKLQHAKLVAVGDLHASYYKLVETMLAANLISMPKEAAQQFLALANHPDNFIPKAQLYKVCDYLHVGNQLIYRKGELAEITKEIKNRPLENSKANIKAVVSNTIAVLNESAFRDFWSKDFKNNLDTLAQDLTLPEDCLSFIKLLDNAISTLDQKISSERAKCVQKQVALYQKIKPLIQTMKWIGGDRQLLLIGDVLSDRGPSDKITLDIIEQLTQGHPDRLIRLASNHDHHAANYNSDWADEQTSSFWVARAVSASLPDPNSILELRQQYKSYLSQSKLMHFDKTNGVLYAHAPIDPDCLERLIDCMNKMDFPTVKNLADIQTPDQIEVFVNRANQFYQHYVTQICESKMTSENYKAFESLLCKGSDTHSPSGFLWNRNGLYDTKWLPFYQKGVKHLVHGHDKNSARSDFHFGAPKASTYGVVNLDQSVRKGSNTGDCGKLFIQR